MLKQILRIAAREQQGFCEGRIQDIEGKLGASQVIDVKDLEQNGRVVFGVTVTIENLILKSARLIKLLVMMKLILKSIKSQ